MPPLDVTIRNAITVHNEKDFLEHINQMVQLAWNEGQSEGYADGHDEGYKCGYDAGRDDGFVSGVGQAIEQ